MTTCNRRTFVILGIAALLTALPVSSARADRGDELRERFKKRLPDIRAAKSAGKIGETRAGVLEAVEEKNLEDKKLRSLMEEENTDRKELFKLIAEKEKTTEEKVAERAAERNFERAQSGEYLKDKDGQWKRKK
jgi:uncharacterized protein YdbL (DUF1318 family)